MTAPTMHRAPTPWAGGRFDGRRGPARLLFGRTFEDPAIERNLFPCGGTVLCIASAGDTALALAAAGLSVIAVDINPAQITETRRRIDGQHPRAGAADRLLALGRTAMVPLGWRSARLATFCQLDDVDAQLEEWQRLTSPLVRATLRAVLSPKILRVAYDEPFARTVPRGFADQLLDRIGQRIANSANRDNPWLSLLLTGTWPKPDTTKAPQKVDLVVGDVAMVLDAQPAGSLDGISLSNVLDGPDSAYADRLLSAARRAGRAGAPIVVRSFLESNDAHARQLADIDRSLLWGGITVHRATGQPT